MLCTTIYPPPLSNYLFESRLRTIQRSFESLEMENMTKNTAHHKKREKRRNDDDKMVDCRMNYDYVREKYWFLTKTLFAFHFPSTNEFFIKQFIYFTSFSFHLIHFISKHRINVEIKRTLSAKAALCEKFLKFALFFWTNRRPSPLLQQLNKT